jgi:hypothetical protein
MVRVSEYWKEKEWKLLVKVSDSSKDYDWRLLVKVGEIIEGLLL